MADWKDIVGLIAPSIGTALGGPLAGQATKMMLQKFGLAPETSEDELASYVQSADPEVLLKLKEVEVEFDKFCVQANVDLEKIAAGDRDSARNREIQVGDRTPAILAAVSTIGFFAVLGAMFFIEIPATAQQPLDIMLGGLIVMVGKAFNYYFGSSAGSKKKNEIIQEFKR